jgi:hypothetical protein
LIFSSVIEKQEEKQSITLAILGLVLSGRAIEKLQGESSKCLLSTEKNRHQLRRLLPGTSKNHRFHPVPGGVCWQFSSLPIF